MIAAHNRRTSDTVERLVVRKIMMLGGGVGWSNFSLFWRNGVYGEPTAEGLLLLVLVWCKIITTESKTNTCQNTSKIVYHHYPSQHVV